MSRRNNRQHLRPPLSLQVLATARSRCTAVLLGAVLLGAAPACAAPAPELSADTARTLQAHVLAVTEAAAADDPARSLKLLDDLGIKLDQAAASGGLSSKRHQNIRVAVDAVRADLAAQQAAADAARAAAEQAAAEQAAADAERAAAQQAAAAAGAPPPVAVVPEPVPPDSDKDKGKGQENGKGKG